MNVPRQSDVLECLVLRVTGTCRGSLNRLRKVMSFCELNVTILVFQVSRNKNKNIDVCIILEVRI